jgi:uncharacterized membrane protein
MKTWVVFCVALVAACVVYSRLPEQIPVHFGINGEPNRYGGRIYIFLPAVVILFLQIVAEVFRRIDPKRKAYEQFESHYYTIMFLVSLIMIMIEMATIALSFQMNFNFTSIVLGACGILLAAIGNMMPKFKHNYFVGIRTSWTLADENVWYLTHRFASKMWVIGGIMMVLCIILPVDIAKLLFGVDLGVMVLIPVVASYLYYKKLHG